MAGLSDIFQGLGSLGSGIYNLVSDEDDGSSLARQAADIWARLESADFDMSVLTPTELKVLATANPTLYNAVVPKEMSRILDSPAMREAQSTALGQIQDVAKEGTPLVDRLAQRKMQMAAGATADRLNENVLQNLAARGRTGGGTEVAARLAASSVGANQAADLGNEMAEAAALRRIAAAGQAGDMASNIRGQDVGVQSANAQFSERYNELVSQLLSQQNASNAQALTEAQAANAANTQRIGDANATAKYATEKDNLERKNALLQELWNQRYAKTSGQSGAMAGAANALARRSAQKAAAIQAVGEGAGKTIGSVGDLAGLGF
jgi:hypothetical protein